MATITDSGYPNRTVASTTTGGLKSFIAPSTRRNSAGNALMMRPPQRCLLEITRSVECTDLPPEVLHLILFASHKSPLFERTRQSWLCRKNPAETSPGRSIAVIRVLPFWLASNVQTPPRG